MKNKSKGVLGEEIALRYLRKRGYEILHRNWYCRWGEIDLVANKNEVLIFIEVKYRTAKLYGAGHKSVNFYKLTALRKSIFRYLYIHDLFSEKCRLDVICILKDKTGYKLKHYRSVSF